MLDKLLGRYAERIRWAGTVLAVFCALCTPLLIHAQDTAGGVKMQHEMVSEGEMEHGDMHNTEDSKVKMDHGHSHQLLDVSNWASVPRVSMKIEKDAMSGWNIYLDAKNFKLTPENVNQENREGEGHAHLYVDEKKVARLYGSWFHLPALPAGRHSIKIQLNANDHSTLAVGQNPVEIIAIVTEE